MSTAISKTELKGHFRVEHWRAGELFQIYDIPNGIVNEGKDLLLDVMFHATSALTTWYIGLINNSPTPSLAATDTYDGIDDTNGWAEFQSYTVSASGTVRGTWTEDAASGQSISNTTLTVFDITDTGNVYGLFVVAGTNAETKGDSTASGNYLWATAALTGGVVPVANGDQLKVTYTVSA
jgi:hypothetical protein